MILFVEAFAQERDALSLNQLRWSGFLSVAQMKLKLSQLVIGRFLFNLIGLEKGLLNRRFDVSGARRLCGNVSQLQPLNQSLFPFRFSAAQTPSRLTLFLSCWLSARLLLNGRRQTRFSGFWELDKPHTLIVAYRPNCGIVQIAHIVGIGMLRRFKTLYIVLCRPKHSYFFSSFFSSL